MLVAVFCVLLRHDYVNGGFILARFPYEKRVKRVYVSIAARGGETMLLLAERSR